MGEQTVASIRFPFTIKQQILNSIFLAVHKVHYNLVNPFYSYERQQTTQI